MADDPNPNPTPEPSPATTPAPAWHEGLTTELKADKTVAHYVERNDLNGMATALVNAQKKIGEQGLSVPGEGATDEDWAKVWDTLGRPGKPEDYELLLPEGYEPTEMEKEAHPKVKALYHKSGLTKRQAETLQEGWQELMTDFNQQLTALEQAAHQQSEAEIERKYPDRRAFDTDRQAGLHFLGGGDREFIEAVQGMRLQTGGYLLEHPSIQIMLARVGGALNEDQRGPGATAGVERRWQSVNDVEAEISRRYAAAAKDRTHPLHPQSTAPEAERQRAQTEIFELAEMKHRKRAG